MRLSTWVGLAAGILLLGCTGLLSCSAKAAAQSPIVLASLTVALWPEYDRPEVLVIYQAELAPEVSLPATVSIEVPASVQQMHAVAYLNEDANALISLDAFRLEATSQGKRLTLTTPVRRFHAEYYADGLLIREGDMRAIHFVFTATTTITSFRFEVQQPLGALDFVSDPIHVSMEQRGDGLFYMRYPVESLTVGTSRSLRVSYRRTTDIPSFDAMHKASETLSNSPVSAAANPELPWGWGIALTGSFFLGAGLGYFMRDRLHRKCPENVPRTGLLGRKLAAHYCYRCGARLYPEALYCHSCGTPRRNIPDIETPE